MGWKELTYSEIRITTGLPPLNDGGPYIAASNSVTAGSVNLSSSVGCV